MELLRAECAAGAVQLQASQAACAALHSKLQRQSLALRHVTVRSCHARRVAHGQVATRSCSHAHAQRRLALLQARLEGAAHGAPQSEFSGSPQRPGRLPLALDDLALLHAPALLDQATQVSPRPGDAACSAGAPVSKPAAAAANDSTAMRGAVARSAGAGPQPASILSATRLGHARQPAAPRSVAASAGRPGPHAHHPQWGGGRPTAHAAPAVPAAAAGRLQSSQSHPAGPASKQHHAAAASSATFVSVSRAELMQQRQAQALGGLAPHPKSGKVGSAGPRVASGCDGDAAASPACSTTPLQASVSTVSTAAPAFELVLSITRPVARLIPPPRTGLPGPTAVPRRPGSGAQAVEIGSALEEEDFEELELGLPPSLLPLPASSSAAAVA